MRYTIRLEQRPDHFALRPTITYVEQVIDVDERLLEDEVLKQHIFHQFFQYVERELMKVLVNPVPLPPKPRKSKAKKTKK